MATAREPLINRIPPIFKDLGVSAFLTILTTVGTIVLLVWLGLHGKVDEALKLSGVLVAMTYKFWDGYLNKRQQDEDRRERMAGTGNGNHSPEAKA